MAGHDADAGGRAVVHLDAVDAQVNPAFVRVFHDRHGAGADVTASIEAVPVWRGEP